MTALVTLTRAQWLAPLKRAWMKLGELLHRVVSPVVLGVIYFGVFTPVGVRDAPLRARRAEAALRAGAPSYWVRRDPPGPADDSFRNLF